MASELRVNTLKDASGNNSIATSFVAGGSAKAWVNLNGGGTAAITDSFNTASITDNGTGDYTVTMTNSMGNANYSLAGLVGGGTGSFNRSISTGYGTAPTASAYTLSSITASNGNLTDCSYVSSQVMGDLA